MEIYIRYLSRHCNDILSNNYPDELKIYISTILPFTSSTNLEEVINKIKTFEIHRCNICNTSLNYFDKNCPNNGATGKLNPRYKNENEMNKFELKHLEERFKNIKSGARSRDNSYLVERNKTDKMRQAVIKKNIKYSGKIMSNLHKKYSGKKICQICNKETFHLMGVGCVECHNKEINVSIICDIHGLQQFSFGGKCIVCEHKKQHVRIVNLAVKNCILINGTEIKFCKSCYRKTPHKVQDETCSYCQVCSGEKIWCERCKRFENNDFNKIDGHWIFYKKKTKNWIINCQNEYLQTRNNINDDTIIELEELNTICCGIYCWYMDDLPFYVGQSKDLLSRSYDHLYSIFCYPDWWNINSKNGILSFRILEKCEQEQLKELESLWITQLQPYSQKCNGSDKIKDLDKRI